MAFDYLYPATFKRGFPARVVLGAVVIGILVPTFVVAGWLASRSADSERAQIEQNVQQRAHEISAILDRELTGIKGMLTTLSVSSSLQLGELATFHAEAKEIARQLGLQIALFDAHRKVQIVDTAVPFGTPLTGGGMLTDEEIERIMETNGPFVSNPFYGPLIKHHAVAVVVPVHPGGGRDLLLAAVFTDDRIRDIFQLVRLKEPYVATVVDRAGVVIARSRKHDEFVGRALRMQGAKFEPGQQGVIEGKNLERAQFRWFYQESPVTDWAVFVGAPADVFNSSVQSGAKILAAAALVLFGIGLTLAYRIGGRFSRAVSELGSVARELPRQAPPHSMSTNLRETNQLLDDLRAVSADLRATDAQQRFAIEAAEIGTWSWDIVRNKLIWSARTREIYRLPPDVEPTIEHFLNSIHPDDRARVRQNMRECFEGVDGYEIEFRALAADGVSVRWLNSKGHVERDLSGAAIFLRGATQDVSERKHNEEERSDLRRQLMRAQEQERLRLAHELHDQTGQSLTAALLEIKQIASSVARNGRPHLDRLRAQLEEIGATVHRIAHELRPTAIEDLGLRAALANHLTEWSDQFGIQSDFHFQCNCAEGSPDASLSDESKTAVYRIAQEALTNVAKHAEGVTAVSLIVNCNGGILQLTIEDNGRGFDIAAPSRRAATPGLGVAGMRERAALIGGTLDIESSPRSGTTVFLRVPFEPRRLVA